MNLQTSGILRSCPAGMWCHVAGWPVPDVSRPLLCLKMFETYHLGIQHCILEEQRPQLHQDGSVTTSIWNFSIHRCLHILHFRVDYYTHFQSFALNLPLLICSKEEVELCKRRDLLEEMLALMSEEFPALGTVFLNERDVFLTHSLQMAAQPHLTSTGWALYRTGNFQN